MLPNIVVALKITTLFVGSLSAILLKVRGRYVILRDFNGHEDEHSTRCRCGRGGFEYGQKMLMAREC